MQIPSKFINEELKKWEEGLPYTPTEGEKRAYVDGLIDAAMYWKWKEKK